MPKKSGNDWRDGHDPVQRWLRIVTTVTVLGVFVVLSIREDNNNDILVIALALGAVLVLLGYEGIVRLPLISRNDGEDHHDEH